MTLMVWGGGVTGHADTLHDVTAMQAHQIVPFSHHYYLVQDHSDHETIVVLMMKRGAENGRDSLTLGNTRLQRIIASSWCCCTYIKCKQ